MPTPEEIAAASAAAAAAADAQQEDNPGGESSTTEGVTTTENLEPEKTESLSTSPAQKDPPPEFNIRKHPEFQAVLKESIERRQKITQLQEQLTNLSDTEGQEEETPPSGESDSSAELRQLRELVDGLAKVVLANQTTQRETTIRQLVVQAGLPEVAAQFITGEDEAAVMAQIEAIQAMTNRPSGITPGGSFVGDAPSTERIKALILGGSTDDGIFSPGNQRATGGGGVERS